jgi:hypothetical protein
MLVPVMLVPVMLVPVMLVPVMLVPVALIAVGHIAVPVMVAIVPARIVVLVVIVMRRPTIRYRDAVQGERGNKRSDKGSCRESAHEDTPAGIDVRKPSVLAFIGHCQALRRV